MSEDPMSSRQSDRIWYFAYGSCLNPSVLGENATRPLRTISSDCDAKVTTLRHFELVFNAWSPIPFEPAFANICSRPGSEVQGVAYSVSREEFERIALSEGASVRSRAPNLSRTIDVVLSVKHTGELIRAKTFAFAASTHDANQRPSSRYAQLVFDGMQHWSLDEKYIEKTGIRNWLSADMTANLSGQSREVLRAFSPNASLPEYLIRSVEERFWAAGDKPQVLDPCKYFEPDSMKSDEGKPFLLFIPGIDGSSLTLLPHMDALRRKYRLRCLVVPPKARSSWRQLEEIVIRALSESLSSSERALVFAESMGAVLALDLASKYESMIESVVVLNPATSFNRASMKSVWQDVLPNLSESVYSLAPFAFIPALYDLEFLLSQLSQSSTALSALKAFGSIGLLGELIPRQTLQHRLNLLHNMPVTDRVLQRIRVPTVVLASANDALIPSASESERLISLIPNSRRVLLSSGGHASMTDARLDIARIITAAFAQCDAVSRRSAALVEDNHDDEQQNFSVGNKVSTKRGRGIIRAHFQSGGKQFEPPTEREINKQIADQEWIRRLFSPVFVGMENIPASLFEQDRPVVFIANHTMYGILDVGLIIAHVLKHRGVLVRGLAHPAVFAALEAAERKNSSSSSSSSSSGAAQAPRTPAVAASVMTKFGAVKVTPRNTYRLLKANEAVLLLPGGAREAYKRRGEKHTLHWPEDPEFVRMALKFNAIVIPVGVVGPDDCFNIIADGDDILNTPVVGKYIRDRVERDSVGSVRGWRSSSALSSQEARDFVPPFAIPSSPRRVYFSFGTPIELAARADLIRSKMSNTDDIGYPEFGQDRDVVRSLYESVEADLEREIQELDSRRQMDLYDKSPLRRILFESWNLTPAPTSWMVSSREGHLDTEF